MGPGPMAYIHLNYGRRATPRSGVIICNRAGQLYHCSFHVSAYSRRGAIHSPDIGDFEFPYAANIILKEIKEMVKTGKPQASYDEMIECIAIATAARLSQKEKRSVTLKEVMEKPPTPPPAPEE